MIRRLGITKTEIMIGVLVAAAIAIALISAVFFDPTGRKGSGLGADSIYDIEELTKIDPALIIYDESRSPISTGFKKARAITVDTAGIIYVAGDQAIKVFDTNGVLSQTIDLKVEATCLAVAESGTMYAGVGNHIEVYDPRGKRTATWQSLGDSAVITAIAVSKDGEVFVADAGNRLIIRYDDSGDIINLIGQKDPDRNVPGLIVPSPYLDLAIPRDGMLRVVNPGRQRIDTYTLDGDFEFSWGRASVDVDGFCGCCNPINIAILPDDSFVTCEKGLNRVKVYDRDGNFKGVVAGPEQLSPDTAIKICQIPEQCQSGGFDVAADSKGMVFVLDTIKNVVRIFSPKEK